MVRRLFCYHVNGQRQLGLSPALAQESDHLCVLQGAKVPFILRERAELGKGKYEVVGEAFAESFMYGEVQFLNFSDCGIILV